MECASVHYCDPPAARCALQRLRFTVPLHQGESMNITLSLAPLVSLVAGIFILIMPRLLNYIVAAYLIVVGLLGLFGDIRLR
jgi:hypothetical protein